MSIQRIETIFDLADDGRIDEAVGMLDSVLATEPFAARLHALRAFLLVQGGRPTEAAASVERATAIDSEDVYVQHAAGEVALALSEPAAAIAAARRGQSLDPDNDVFIMLEARARALLGQWDEVRSRMDYILAANPDNESAALLRALAVESKQGKRGTLGAADWENLAQRFPLNSFARTGYAWRLLQQGGSRQAREEFQQALTVDPGSEWAKQGLVLALKTKYPGYGILLRYFFWSNTLAPRTRTLIAIGGVLGYNFLRNAARADPELKPFVVPLLVAYGLFLISTWLADPLLSLVLMRHPEGRRVLSEDDRRSGMAVGLCLAAAMLLALIGLLTPWKSAYLGAVAVAFTSLTVAGAYNCEPGKYRTRLFGASTVFLALGLASAIVPDPLSGSLLGIAMVGVAISTWVARSWAARSLEDR